MIWLLLLSMALAAEPDPRGWSHSGPVAAAADAFREPPELPSIALPRDFVRSLKGPTLLVYFSPTCPHCIRVTPELEALRERLAGKAELVLIAASGATDGELAEYRSTLDVKARIVPDQDRNFGIAMGIRSTPSALLVRPLDKKGNVQVLDAWYPYEPGFDTLVELRLAGDFSPFKRDAYQGVTVCAACHLEEAKAWQLSHHSAAWRGLTRDLSDPKALPEADCIPCHVTGFGQPGGFDPDAPEGRVVDVGCEACHSPGGPHDGADVDANAACAGCHDPDHSIAFDATKAVALIDHFSAVDLSQEEMMARRKLLWEGDAPQPLLAFDKGENVGSQACKSCHEAAYAAWSASDHAQAMATLQAQEKTEDVGCVSCHATAKPGPAPTTLAGFRRDEAVGCEACHGPGTAHVAAKGAPDTIEGLGSDCPVCVLDAVCTRCHTPRWDPNWELSRDLKRSKGHHTPPLPE